jgi:glyoxylase-like metal-dependent hydrolase (beta-lactamase superfamily II)
VRVTASAERRGARGNVVSSGELVIRIRAVKRLGTVLVALVAVVAVFCVWAFVVPDGAPDTKWPFDVAELRRLAGSIEGERPSEVRVERISTWAFPGMVQILGTSPAMREMTCYSYQLVFPTRTAVVDTALDEKTAREGIPGVRSFDTAAYERVRAALDTADFIVATHEHFDHIGGAMLSPKGWERFIANKEQLEHPELVKPLTYPSGKPGQVLEYAGAKAVAPGVVLVRAPGHTPGSQLVYVQTAAGAELLFLGDVAWQMENVERVQTVMRVASFLGIDRTKVRQQLAALHDLDPKVKQVAGHDGPRVEALIKEGALISGFATR